MKIYLLNLIICGILCNASSQTPDSTSQLQNIKSKIVVKTPCNTNWEDILPALKTIKYNPKVKKERLYNVVKILKYLLADDAKDNGCEVNEILSAFEDSEEEQSIPDIEKTLQERFKSVDKATGPKASVIKEIEVKNDNKTADLNRILSKINIALDNYKYQNADKGKPNPTQTVPIFRSNDDFNTPSFDYPSKFEDSRPNQLGKGVSSASIFNIPCQKASDILAETASYSVPKDAFCDVSPKPINLDSLGLSPRLNLESLGINPSQVVPNSVSCADSNDTIGVIFKPKIVSMMQVYGNMLKKITLSVLVPYYAAKIGS